MAQEVPSPSRSHPRGRSSNRPHFPLFRCPGTQFMLNDCLCSPSIMPSPLDELKSRGIGLIGGMILITVFVANVPLPDVAWGGGAAAAAILFWCGMFGY